LILPPRTSPTVKIPGKLGKANTVDV
jgi:hypothetical protein